MSQPLRIGFLGASRGLDFAECIRGDYPYATVAAVCESYAPLREKACVMLASYGMQVEGFADYDEMLEQAGLDAVVIANFANEHVPYALKALKKGIHVYSEVMPVQTMAEAVALCEAVEESGCVYAYGENYCFFNSSYAMRQVYESGVIGEAVCLEGTFINDCSPKWELLTRGARNHWRNYVPSTFYCSHSIGPMLYSTGLRAVRVNGVEMPRMDYLAKQGARSGSAAMELMELNNGGMARSMNGNLRHPYEASYRLIGENGSILCGTRTLKVLCYTSGFDFEEQNVDVQAPDFLYRPKSENHSFPAESNCTAFGLFIGQILGDVQCRKYSIDVYTALDMAMPGLLAYRSIVDGGKPYTVPDLRDKVVREQYRQDYFSTDPKTPEAYRLPTNKNGTPDVPDSVYEAVQEHFLQHDLTPGMK